MDINRITKNQISTGPGLASKANDEVSKLEQEAKDFLKAHAGKINNGITAGELDDFKNKEGEYKRLELLREEHKKVSAPNYSDVYEKARIMSDYLEAEASNMIKKDN